MQLFKPNDRNEKFTNELVSGIKYSKTAKLQIRKIMTNRHLNLRFKGVLITLTWTKGRILKNFLPALALITMLSCGQDTPLAEYEPKSSQEQALKNVLLTFQVGVNSKDVKKVAGLIHENASIMVGREREIFSKAKYVKILPKRLAENPPIALGQPKIKISDDKADVKIYMSRGNSRALVVFHMQLDDNRWYIKSWDY